MFCSCGEKAVGTFWVAYHNDPTMACVAEACCEICGDSWERTWNDGFVKYPRPKGFWPGVITNSLCTMSHHLNEKK